MKTGYCARCRATRELDLTPDAKGFVRPPRCPEHGVKLFVVGSDDPAPTRFWCARCRAARSADRCAECGSRCFAQSA